MPATGENVTQADMATLCGSAPSVGWIGEYFTPGVLNALRRQIREDRNRIDPPVAAEGLPGGDRGYPACAVSGPWVIPAAKVYAAGTEGVVPGLPAETPWVGLVTTKAGAFPEYADLRVVAEGEISALNARCDVGVNTEMIKGWRGTWHPYTELEPWEGWLDLAYEVGITPSTAEVGPSPGNADGLVWVDLYPGSGTLTVECSVNGGTPAAITGTDIGSGVFRYPVVVAGAQSGGVLSLEFTWEWTEPPYPPVASGWGAEYSVRHGYGAGGSYPAALAQAPRSVAAAPLLEVVVAGSAQSGYSAGQTYLWPEFVTGGVASFDRPWCFIGKTLPIKSARFCYGYGMAPGYFTASSEMVPVPFSAPIRRTAAGNPGEMGTYPEDHWEGERYGPPTVSNQPIWSVLGVWISRFGKGYDHAPLLPARAASSVCGPEVVVEIGTWRSDTGAFEVVSTVTLADTERYVFVRFSEPWPVLAPHFIGYRAKVSGVMADVVSVTAPSLADVTLPDGGPIASILDDWDCAWNGSSAGGIDRNGDSALVYPGSSNNPATPWVDFPPVSLLGCPPLAWYSDTSALS